MFSLFLVVIYVGMMLVFSNSTPMQSLDSTMPFLWYWHLMFASFKALFFIALTLISSGVVIIGKDFEEKIAGVGLTIISTVLAVLALASSALFLTGVYLMDHSIVAGDIVDQNKFYFGVIVYILALLMQMSSRFSYTSTKD